MPSGSWHISRNRQRLWQLFFTGIFHDQHVVASRWQTASQLHCQLGPETPVSAPPRVETTRTYCRRSLTSLPLHTAMSGWRGVTLSVGHGCGKWLSLTQLASFPDMEGAESRDRYLYSRQLETPPPKNISISNLAFEVKNKQISSCDSTVSVQFVLLAAVRSRDVGTGVGDSHLQDGGFVVGAGQQDQVILRRRRTKNNLIPETELEMILSCLGQTQGWLSG